MREVEKPVMEHAPVADILTVDDKKLTRLESIFFDDGKRRYTVTADLFNYFLSDKNKEVVGGPYDSIHQIVVQKGENKSVLLYAKKNKEQIWLLPPDADKDQPKFHGAGKYEKIYYDTNKEKFIGEKNGKKIKLVLPRKPKNVNNN